MAIFRSRYGILEVDAISTGGINISLAYYEEDYGLSASECLSPEEAVVLYKALGDYLCLDNKPDLEN